MAGINLTKLGRREEQRHFQRAVVHKLRKTETCGKAEWKVGQIDKVNCHSQIAIQRASLSVELSGWHERRSRNNWESCNSLYRISEVPITEKEGIIKGVKLKIVTWS